MKNTLFYSIIILLCLPTTNFASPSFDCRKARSNVEKHICASSELSRQDRLLSEKYNRLLNQKLPDLENQQISWLRKRNKCGKRVSSEVANCISEQYRIRIQELEQLESEVKAIHDKTWKKHFVKSESEIPTDSFKAYYFDERTAGIIRHTDIIKNPSIHYVRENFHDIPAGHIGAYYIGKFNFNKSTILNLNTFQGRGESSLFVNGKKVREGSKYSVSNEYLFEPGVHTIEIQYISNYSSANFLFTMTAVDIAKDTISLTDNSKSYRDSDIWYCGVYETDNFNGHIYIDLASNDRPVVLFLSSYEPVIWDFKGSKTNFIKEIYIFSKHHSSILLNINKKIPVTYIKKFPWVYDTHKSGSTDKTNNFKNLVYTIQDITKQKPTGFSGKYSLGSVHIPEKTLDESFYKTIGMSLHAPPQAVPSKLKSRLDRVFE